MNVLFRCEYKLTKKHIRESKRFTLFKVKHFDYILYVILGISALAIIIRAIVVHSLFPLIVCTIMFSTLVRYAFRFRKIANSVAQEEVYPGEKIVSEGILVVTETDLTFYNSDLTSEVIDLSSITCLGISVDVITLYINGHKNKIIPQYSFIEGNKYDFAKMLEEKGISLKGNFTN